MSRWCFAGGLRVAWIKTLPEPPLVPRGVREGLALRLGEWSPANKNQREENEKACSCPACLVRSARLTGSARHSSLRPLVLRLRRASAPFNT